MKLLQGGQFPAEARGQGTVALYGVDDRLHVSGFSRKEDDDGRAGAEDWEKNGQGLEEDEWEVRGMTLGFKFVTWERLGMWLTRGRR